MKRIVLIGMILCMTLVYNGCDTKRANEKLNSIKNQVIEKENSDQQEQGIDPNKQIESMNEEDLTVTDGTNMITLDSLYDTFETTEEEINTNNSEDNYVGEIPVGEYIYKTYSHRYKDFEIYTSNMNYPYNEDDIDTYYITQIDLTSSKYMTARGASVGVDIDEVYDLYGEGKLTSDTDETNNTDKELIYQFNNYELSFTYDGQGVVKKITLVVLPLEEDSNTKANNSVKNESDILAYSTVQGEIDSYMTEFSNQYTNTVLELDEDNSGIEINTGTINIHSTEGNEVNQYVNNNGEILRYSINQYGEMGTIRYDYYKLNEDMIYVTELITTYSCPINIGGDIDILSSNLSKYIIDTGKLYHVDNYEEKIIEIKNSDDTLPFMSFEDLSSNFTETEE